MALNIQIFSDNRLFPQVFNVVQGTNKVDAVVFTMENYIVGEKDLSTYDWYAHLMGVEGIDAVKLTSAIVDGKLQITFDLTEYVTQLGNTLTYQIVAKDDISSVWNSGKGVILNAESIPADDKIVADYASILRQWELRMEEIAGSLDTAIYYIPYGEDLPKEKRVTGRLYYKYLYAENLNGQLEDSNGNILIPEQVAKNIGISAIDGLTASDVQTALEALKTMIENKDSLPAQDGQDGKFLKTVDGKAEWAEVEALPEQEGQDGKFLKTVDGKAVWEDVPRGLPLLSSIWADHKLNDASYLLADNFSWHSGDVYKAAYEHLANEIEAFSGNKAYAWYSSTYGYMYTRTATPSVGDYGYEVSFGYLKIVEVGADYIKFVDSTDTAETYTRTPSEDREDYMLVDVVEANGTVIGVWHWQVEDGHKIAPYYEESQVSAMYEATGVAWYYLLDTENKQFKLPRSKHNKYADTLPVVGNGLNLGLTDGTTNYGFGFKASDQALKGRPDFYGTSVGTIGALGGVASAAASGKSLGVTTDSENSGVIATQEQDTDQYKYLYFYVGNYLRGIDEVNVGAWAELANGVDVAKLTEDVNEVKDAALAEIASAGEATANFQQPLVTLSATSGTVSLEINKIYSMAISGDLTFVLPASVNTNFFNQIKVMAQITGTPVITWGTTYFVNKEEPTIEEGCYDFYFDWDNNLGGWVLGAVTKG